MKGGKKRTITAGGETSARSEQDALGASNGWSELAPSARKDLTAREEGEEQEEAEGDDFNGYDYDDENDDEEGGEGEEYLQNTELLSVYRDSERPNLGEGFYEIEAVRRRRVRKGRLQYLIKWRGWPETANTWEPLENLQSCADVIEAFEESLKVGKRKSSRRRKRRYSGFHSLPRKECGTDNMKTVVTNDQLLSPVALPFNDSATLCNYNLETDSNFQGMKQVTNNGDVSSQSQQCKDENELDRKLNEQRTTVFDTEEYTIKPSLEDNLLRHGPSTVDHVEPIQESRCTGAKRRKSGSVRRFKKDSPSSEANNANGGTTINFFASSDKCGLQGIEESGVMGNSNHKDNFNRLKNATFITEIMRPMSYSASVSNNVQDVLVTFLAKRSDGREVIVDNKFLKTNNPSVLINFYEQNLRYSPSS